MSNVKVTCNNEDEAWELWNDFCKESLHDAILAGTVFTAPAASAQSVLDAITRVGLRGVHLEVVPA